MCYICEERGEVGANYKAAQREIEAALRVWHHKPADFAGLSDRAQDAWRAVLRRRDQSRKPTPRLWE